MKHQPVLSNASNAVNLVVHLLSDLQIPARVVQLVQRTVNIPSATISVMHIELGEALPNQLHVAHSLSSCWDNTITVQVLNAS